eukprot:scaffold28154_cov56-Phaeocystis_antarctica.AAC.3
MASWHASTKTVSNMGTIQPGVVDTKVGWAPNLLKRPTAPRGRPKRLKYVGSAPLPPPPPGLRSRRGRTRVAKVRPPRARVKSAKVPPTPYVYYPRIVYSEDRSEKVRKKQASAGRRVKPYVERSRNSTGHHPLPRPHTELPTSAHVTRHIHSTDHRPHASPSAWHLRPRQQRQEELLERVGVRVELQPLLPRHDEPAGQAGRSALRGAVGAGAHPRVTLVGGQLRRQRGGEVRRVGLGKLVVLRRAAAVLGRAHRGAVVAQAEHLGVGAAQRLEQRLGLAEQPLALLLPQRGVARGVQLEQGAQRRARRAEPRRRAELLLPRRCDA